MKKMTTKQLRVLAKQIKVVAMVEGYSAEKMWNCELNNLHSEGLVSDKHFKMAYEEFLISRTAMLDNAFNAYIATMFEEKAIEIVEYRDNKNVGNMPQSQAAYIVFNQMYLEMIKHDKRGLSNVAHMENWLSGLALNIDFNYCDIEARLKSFGYTEKEIENGSMIDKWFSIMAFKCFKYFRKACKMDANKFLDGLRASNK